jgi:hypothetical protein
MGGMITARTPKNVMAVLDTAIHAFPDLEDAVFPKTWIRGSSPRMTVLDMTELAMTSYVMTGDIT